MLTQAGKKKMEELHKKMLMHKKNKGKDEHDGAVATKRKWRSGTVAVREIRRLSKTTNSLMNKMPFKRLVRDILNKCNGDARYATTILH